MELESEPVGLHVQSSPYGATELLFRHRGTLLFLAAIPIAASALGGTPISLWEVVVGALLLGNGAALRLASIRRIGKRARVARAGAASLLCEGPYARVRNPLYLANLHTAGGACVLAGLGAWSAAVVLFVGLVYHAVVLVEEARLLEIFGEAYERYRAGVPRWVPAPRAHVLAGAAPATLWPWRDVLRREGGSLAGVAGVLAGLVYLRWPGPFMGELGRFLDVAAHAATLPRWALVAALVLVVAAGEGLVTHVKRRRHRIARERIASELSSARALNQDVDEGR